MPVKLSAQSHPKKNIQLKKRLVYLDYASTTPVDPQVVQAMAPFWTEKFGNPSNLYSLGQTAFQALENAREKIARSFSCQANEIIFTGGGTESDNLALRGLAKKFPGGHLIISNIEHHAVLKTALDLKNSGWKVSLAPVRSNGIINLSKLKLLIQPNTFLVSIMWVNNEIGTIQPIGKISRWVRKLNIQRISRGLNKIYLHTDACQALPYLKINLSKTKLDLLTFNGSKIYAPKGVGGLYVRKNTPLRPIITGGDQELGWRAGTQNVAAIVGLAKAVELLDQRRDQENQRLRRFQNYLIQKLSQSYPEIVFNPRQQNQRVSGNLNFSIPGIEGEALTLMLDRYGICAATGSACASSDLKPSYVLTAIGRSDELAHCSIRLTFGKYTTQTDLDYFLEKFQLAYQQLKKISAR